MMKKRLMWAGLITLVVFPLVGWAILQFFREDPIAIMLRGSMSVGLQIIFGLVVGWIFGLIAKWVVKRPFMQPIEHKYAQLIKSLQLKPVPIILLSFCAGFGEELLFRGALQPLMGLWTTAIVFVAIHGYLNPWDWRMSVYGITMTLLIACLGLMTEVWGIFSACAAHMAIDIVLFNYLAERSKTLNYPDI